MVSISKGVAIMWTIGFVDDDKSCVEDYQIRLKRKDIQLVFAENCKTKEDIAEWILKNNLKCVLIDYRLRSVYNFLGTDLVAYLNTELPDLSCIILTNFPEESVSENLVVRNLILDRNVLDGTKLEDFAQTIIQAIEVSENRLQLHIEEFNALKIKRDASTQTAADDERFLGLYKLLRAYNEVDDIPIDLLDSNTNRKMDAILSKLDEFIEKTK